MPQSRRVYIMMFRSSFLSWPDEKTAHSKWGTYIDRGRCMPFLRCHLLKSGRKSNCLKCCRALRHQPALGKVQWAAAEIKHPTSGDDTPRQSRHLRLTQWSQANCHAKLRISNTISAALNPQPLFLSRFFFSRCQYVTANAFIYSDGGPMNKSTCE